MLTTCIFEYERLNHPRLWHGRKRNWAEALRRMMTPIPIYIKIRSGDSIGRIAKRAGISQRKLKIQPAQGKSLESIRAND